MTPRRLIDYRKQSGLSQGDLGGMLRVSHSAVNRWENGQEIPGPADILLDWLIDGVVPFQGTVHAGKATLPQEAVDGVLGVQTNLRTWREIVARSEAAGYADPVDWIASLIIDNLNQETEGAEQTKDSLIDNLNRNLVNTGVCAQNSSGAAAATFTDIDLKNPLRPGLGATIVPLPETHWAPPVERLHAGGGSQESLAAEKAPGDGSEAPELPERREARYEPPAKKRKK